METKPLEHRKTWVRQVWDDAVFLLACLLVALGLALMVNSFRTKPLPLIREAEDLRLARTVGGLSPFAAALPEVAAVDLDEAIEAQSQGREVFVDAREEAFYSIGHIAGARSLPRKGFEKQFPRFAKDIPKDRAVIVYCSGVDCEDSEIVAKALVRIGYTHVRIFRGGWEEWQAAGLPTEP